MIEIVVNRENRDQARYSFDYGTITVGRGPTNEIHLNSQSVAEQQIEILLDKRDCLMQSLVSDAAIFVNDKAVQQTRLYNQDVIRIADFELKVFSDELTRNSNAAPTQPEAKQKMSTPDLTDVARTLGLSSTFDLADLQLAVTLPEAENDKSQATPSPALDEPEEDCDGNQLSLLGTGIDLMAGPAKGRRIYFTGRRANLGVGAVIAVSIDAISAGYRLTCANNDLTVYLNGKPVEDGRVMLNDGDVIDFSNLSSQFFLDPTL